MTERNFSCDRDGFEHLLKWFKSEKLTVVSYKMHPPRPGDEFGIVTVSCVDDAFTFLGWDGIADVHHGELIAVHRDKPDWIVKSFTTAKNPLKKSSTVLEGEMYHVRKSDAYRLPCAIAHIMEIPDGFEVVSK